MTNPLASRKHLIISLLLICLTIAAHAQTGAVRGTIKTPDGSSVEGASIYIESIRRGTQSDQHGNFEIQQVPAGTHNVRVSVLGFQQVRKTVDVSAGVTASLDVSLSEADVLLKEVTITSTGIKDEIKDIPGTVNVIDGNQIRESGAQSVGQVISRIPGVNYLDEDGRGLKPNIGLRGLDPLRNRNLLVLIDGKFPIGMTLYGDPAAYYMIPLQQVERVEVIKGASPVLYGGYSVGGVVNMITKRGEQIPQTRAELSMGSWNALTAQISTGADNGKFNYYLAGLRRQGDGYRANSKFGVDDYTARLGVKVDETSEVSIYLNYFGENSDTPGGLTQAQYDEDPTHSQHNNDRFSAARFSTAISYKKQIAPEQVISTSIYGNFFRRDWWIQDASRDAQGITTFLDTNQGYLRDIHAIGNVLDYNLTKPIGGNANSLIVGTRVHGDRLDDINVRGQNALARVGPTTANKINSSFIYEAFIYDEFSVAKDLVIAPGVRYTNVQYKRNDLYFRNSSNQIVGRKDEMNVDAFVYSFGAIYKIQDHSRIYGTFSKGFQPPALNSSLAPLTVDAGDLGAETSKNIEVGVRTAPVPWFAVNISAYRMNFDNKVVTVNGVNRNVGESLHRGVEAEVEAGPWYGFSIFANASFQKATLVSDDELDGNILPLAPQRIAATGLRYKAPVRTGKLVFNLSHNYVGKQYSDLLNTENGNAGGTVGAIPSYHVTNFAANFDRKRWGVFGSVNNLLDRKYFTLRWASWSGIIPSPGRGITVGMNYKF